MPVIDEGLPYGQLEERSLRMLEIGSAFSLAETGRSLRVRHAQGATPISHIERLRGLSSGVFRQPVNLTASVIRNSRRLPDRRIGSKGISEGFWRARR